MVGELVDHRGGKNRVSEDVAPDRERLVGGDDIRSAFVAGRDELHEQVGCLSLKGDAAHLVDDDGRREQAEPPQARPGGGIGAKETTFDEKLGGPPI